jgi:hypothetical protein
LNGKPENHGTTSDEEASRQIKDEDENLSGSKRPENPSNQIMNAKSQKLVGLVVLVAVLGLGWFMGLHAQTAPNKPSSSQVTTNWIGCAVVGQEDRLDPIAPGPHATTVPKVEIGLRSDGVVVWRNALAR